MMVKVCGITHREDAVAAVDAGATALGFIFYPKSPRYVQPEAAAELGDGLDVWKVGVFVGESPSAIEAVMRAARMDVAQVYGGAAPEGGRVWRAFRVGAGWQIGDLPYPPDTCEALFLDGAANGVSFDWKIARDAGQKVIIAGGLDASNVAQAIRVARPWGVDASSKLESAPGIKDHEKVRRFVEAARDAS
jgi:phosphoribosylanthranilate isomerase